MWNHNVQSALRVRRQFEMWPAIKYTAGEGSRCTALRLNKSTSFCPIILVTAISTIFAWPQSHRAWLAGVKVSLELSAYVLHSFLLPPVPQQGPGRIVKLLFIWHMHLFELFSFHTQMTTSAVLLRHWTQQYQKTAANTIWKNNITFVVYSQVGFPFRFISFPHPTSTRSVFAAEIVLGPKGRHIPSLTVVQSLTITVPPHPPSDSLNAQNREASCPGGLGNVLWWMAAQPGQ